MKQQTLGCCRMVLIVVVGWLISEGRLSAQTDSLYVEKLQQDVARLRKEVKDLRRQVCHLQGGYYDYPSSAEEDTLHVHSYIHQVGVEARPQYVFPTNPFLRGENERWKPIRSSFVGHLRYSFKFRPGTCADRLYGGAYQGIGVSMGTFGDKKQLGDPFAFYVFQGARILRVMPRLSLNYEWNFGISAGWQIYDNVDNSYNGAVGSHINAYINAGIYLNWTLSRYFDLNIGGDFTHYSNGNTKFPNAGINTTGAKIGLVYNFNRRREDLEPSGATPWVLRFPRHVSYDVLLFGSWRRKGVYVGDGRQVASPGSYPVAGFNIAPMYNFGYKFRAGLSVDGVYDGSANVSYEGGEFYLPSVNRQLALGLSARGEFVMPYFTIGAGIGANVIGSGDLKGFYQLLALKIAVARDAFLHIGYNLQNFKTPNYLMLGLGFRLHNKYPKVRH